MSTSTKLKYYQITFPCQVRKTPFLQKAQLVNKDIGTNDFQKAD